MTRAGRSATVGMVLVLVAGLATAQSRPLQSTPALPADAGSQWAKGNQLVLGVTQPALGFSAQWRFRRSAEGDILLDLEESRADSRRAGSLLLLAEGALLSRELTLPRGSELDAIQGPLLMLQLVLRLLERGVPAGPDGIVRELPIDVTEAHKPMRVSAIGADGEFHAPWSLQGVIAGASGGQVRFELEFVSATRARSTPWHETSIAGIWRNASPPLALPDAMPLRGWRVYQIRAAATAQRGARVAGLGTSAPMAFANLGDVRRRAREWADQHDRRARWQCR